MRAKPPSFSALRGVAVPGQKKVLSMGNVMRFHDFSTFSEKQPAGSSFHVYVMQAHARKGPVAVAGVEKMLAKVPWGLGEVS